MLNKDYSPALAIRAEDGAAIPITIIRGKDGPQGPQGDPGVDGKDYEITEKDYDEIAEEVKKRISNNLEDFDNTNTNFITENDIPIKGITVNAKEVDINNGIVGLNINDTITDNLIATNGIGDIPTGGFIPKSTKILDLIKLMLQTEPITITNEDYCIWTGKTSVDIPVVWTDIKDLKLHKYDKNEINNSITVQEIIKCDDEYPIVICSNGLKLKTWMNQSFTTSNYKEQNFLDYTLYRFSIPSQDIDDGGNTHDFIFQKG